MGGVRLEIKEVRERASMIIYLGFKILTGAPLPLAWKEGPPSGWILKGRLINKQARDTRQSAGMKARARPEGTEGAVKIGHSSAPEAARSQDTCWVAAWRPLEAGAEVRAPRQGRGSARCAVSATDEDRRTDAARVCASAPCPLPSLSLPFFLQTAFPRYT